MRAAIEEMFTRMAKRHKYTTGIDLRAAAKAVVVAVRRAWKERDDKTARVVELTDAVDLLLLELQLGKDVNAFGRWPEFEAVARLAQGLSQQSGGWLRSLRSTSQNAQASSPGQRAQTLSSRSAHEATS